MPLTTIETNTGISAQLNGQPVSAAARIAIVGGGGAMGGLFGALLAKSGHNVTAVDVSIAAVEAINRNGLRLEGADGKIESVRFGATTNPGEVGPV
ncbi:MAG: 2-dehydropantoate 2-reductase N-terminal domain-containing protein, partial [Opitutaceae bacterium]